MQTATARKPRISVPASLLPVAGYGGGVAVILVFFLYFVVPGYRNGFAPDDMMNIAIYWESGPWKLIKGLLLFWSTYYRPMGGVFYSILYHFFGLHPLAYHVVIDALLLFNIWLAFRLARLLSGSAWIAGLTALFVTYHAWVIIWLTYLPSFIYDTLCFTFYFSALNYYVSIRLRGAALNKKQIAVFILLSVCAFDSKEMAASLPAVILIWELIWYPPLWRSRAAMRRWALGAAFPGLLLGVLTLVYAIGKTHGPGSLTAVPAYQSTFTPAQYARANAHFINELLYVDHTHPWSELQCLLIWVAMLYLAWRMRAKHLWFAAFFVILSPLPITFIPARGGGCLYIPLFGWALAISTVYFAIAAILKNEPLFRRVPLQAVYALLAVIAVIEVWKVTARHDMWLRAPFANQSVLTRSVLQQLRNLLPTVKPNTRIAWLKSPFPDWDVKFITELNYGDHSVVVWPTHQVPLPPRELAKFDIILTWENGRLKQVKPPPAAPAS